MRLLNVPAAKFHQDPADVFSCPLSESLDWLIGNSLLPLLLQGSGLRQQKNTKGHWRRWWMLRPPLHAPEWRISGWVFLRVLVVHLLAGAGSKERKPTTEGLQ